MGECGARLSLSLLPPHLSILYSSFRDGRRVDGIVLECVGHTCVWAPPFLCFEENDENTW